MPVQFTLRDYRPEDFNTLWEIDQSCFAPGIAYSQFELRSYIRGSGTLTLVAEAAESEGPSPTSRITLGFLIAEARRGAGHIITLDVRSQARRHGVGSTLMEVAESRMAGAKCRLVRLETAVDNVSALAFYKRLQYDVVETIPRYYSNGLDALLLEKSLLSPPTPS
jgi:ribosomal-protein-alanine N-acetyltransferase